MGGVDQYRIKQKLLAKRQSNLKIKATSSEKKVFDILSEMGINFIFQKGFISGGEFCIVDFYLPRPYKICIEVDGGYHETEKQKWRDYYREKYLCGKRKLKVLRITNREVETLTVDKLMEMINSL